jgi:hypothetical protein
MEIHFWAIASLLIDSRIVDTKLDDLAQAAPFLSEVDYNSNTSALRALYRLSQCKNQIRSATADVAAKDIRADTLVMHSHGSLCLGISKLPRISEGVDSAASNSWYVSPHFGVKKLRIMRVPMQTLPKLVLSQVEPF